MEKEPSLLGVVKKGVVCFEGGAGVKDLVLLEEEEGVSSLVVVTEVFRTPEDKLAFNAVRVLEEMHDDLMSVLN